MLEYPELGMEAVWKIEVVDFPAFIVVDDKGNDFFDQVRQAPARPSVSSSARSGRTSKQNGLVAGRVGGGPGRRRRRRLARRAGGG